MATDSQTTLCLVRACDEQRLSASASASQLHVRLSSSSRHRCLMHGSILPVASTLALIYSSHCVQLSIYTIHRILRCTYVKLLYMCKVSE